MGWKGGGGFVVDELGECCVCEGDGGGGGS